MYLDSQVEYSCHDNNMLLTAALHAMSAEMSLRIDIVPNRSAKPQILLRKSWRVGKRVRHKTVGNLTGLPPEMVESFRAILRGGIALGSIDDALG